ncbi:AP-3 complex subunit delta [Tritrichomonas foetus]|uniref:AP-3 complex subunit delta n=1 Tax=Tritrichomonas foetus TaxID=1144522 RepID=A0A1J4KZC6_9EUKA|nr:AP-3 complex subunit delta [Tritrichomonas foetus]|eukprot:OHT14941.1 AP-3 complex subunit delta [Tritrichomonas foetus]
MITGRNLNDVIRTYLKNRAANNEQNYVAELVAKMQDEINHGKAEDKIDIVQQVIFLNLRGHDTTWAEFCVLEVMSLDSFSAKRIAYTAAAQMWTSTSDVVLMATNRIERDLTSIQPLLSALVLTSLPPYLSLALSQSIAHDVIALMSAAKPVVRQKAIMTFYHICLKYPDALRPGFTTLLSRLDDADTSVVFSALTVMSELCAHNVQNFVQLIPKFHKMLEASTSNWVTLRLIYIMRMLSAVEPRLPRKLIGPFTTILETTSSITVLFECVRTIIDIPITNTILLTYATNRMQSFLEHEDVNLRFLCLSLFIKLIEIQPKLVAQHKDLITKCLDSTDESTRLLALDLLAALANTKTIDGIVAKMFDHFKQSKSVLFKNQIFARVIDICSNNDYDLVNDFDWYITILMDFVAEGGFTCYDTLSEQLLDLALRVPDTRERLVEEMGGLFENVAYKDATSLLLAASHIIAEYATNSNQIEKVIFSLISETDERVQESCISTAFKLYLKAEGEEKMIEIENLFDKQLPLFEASTYAEVQDQASLTRSLIEIIKKSREGQAVTQLKDMLIPEYQEDFEPLERPAELDEPIDIFHDEEETVDESAGSSSITEALANEIGKSSGSSTTKERKKSKQASRHQRQVTKPKILKISTDKNAGIAKPASATKRPAVLSNDLANVDLTQIIADEEAQALPRPMPYVQEQLMKNQQQNANKKSGHGHGRHGHGHRHRKGEPANIPVAPPKPPPAAPITGPKPYSRVQTLGENSCMTVNATEFSCSSEKPSTLDIDLSILNNSLSVLTAIDISVPATNVKPVSLPSYNQIINSGEKATHKISLEFQNILIPQKVRLIFVPTDSGAETLEANLLIFPSFFLFPGDPANIETATAAATHIQKLKPVTQAKPRDILQTVVNVLRSAIIKGSDQQTRTLYSRTTQNHEVVCLLQVDVSSVFIELRASDPTLSKDLIREIELKIKMMNE